MGRLIAVAVAIVAATLALGASPAAAQEADDPLRVIVTLDGRNIADRVVEFDPARPAELSVTAINSGTTPKSVRLVRVSGVALALTFFAYDTTIPFEVPAQGQATRTFPLDVRDLRDQAIGLLPTSVELLDEERVALGEVDTVADVRGSFLSVYGVFGVAVFALTALTWVAALLALARHRLPPNRFRRALRFLPAGIGTGLVAVVTLSVLRLVPPEPVVEIPVVLGAAVIAMVLGFLTPHPTPAAPAAGPDDVTVGVTTRKVDQGWAG